MEQALRALNDRVRANGKCLDPMGIRSDHPLVGAIRDGDEQRAFDLASKLWSQAHTLTPIDEPEDVAARTKARFHDDDLPDSFNFFNEEPFQCRVSVLVEGFWLPEVFAVHRKQGSHVESVHLWARDSQDDYAVLKRCRWAEEARPWSSDALNAFDPAVKEVDYHNFDPVKELCWRKAVEMV